MTILQRGQFFLLNPNHKRSKRYKTMPKIVLFRTAIFSEREAPCDLWPLSIIHHLTPAKQHIKPEPTTAKATYFSPTHPKNIQSENQIPTQQPTLFTQCHTTINFIPLPIPHTINNPLFPPQNPSTTSPFHNLSQTLAISTLPTLFTPFSCPSCVRPSNKQT